MTCLTPSGRPVGVGNHEGLTEWEEIHKAIIGNGFQVEQAACRRV